MSLEIDVVVLSRVADPLHELVEGGIAVQGGDQVSFRIHRVIGTPSPLDPNGWATICRARNEGVAQTSAPWVMFVDDDVVLAPGCLQELVQALGSRPGHGALAADYLEESTMTGPWTMPDIHVALGATLFRRSALERIRFRWEPDRCECQCCCDDLRRLGYAISYLPQARAYHDPRLRTGAGESPSPRASSLEPTRTIRQHRLEGRILAAFDRRHWERFRRVFLRSLRSSGNPEQVTVVAYGLYASEQRTLAWIPNLEVVPLPLNGESPPVRRVRDFGDVVADWPPSTPVAYWDAGDVLFQSSLAPLWSEVAAHPSKLLAVREPAGHPENAAVAEWTLSIADPEARQRAFTLLSRRPFLNSGFAAGTARSMLAYFREADRMLHSPDLLGTADWGDQTALNLYCHTDPDRWTEVEQEWNYCLHDRRPGEVGVSLEGRIVASNGQPIHVVHGNASSFPPLLGSRLFV